MTIPIFIKIMCPRFPPPFHGKQNLHFHIHSSSRKNRFCRSVNGKKNGEKKKQKLNSRTHTNGEKTNLPCNSGRIARPVETLSAQVPSQRGENGRTLCPRKLESNFVSLLSLVSRIASAPRRTATATASRCSPSAVSSHSSPTLERARESRLIFFSYFTLSRSGER